VPLFIRWPAEIQPDVDIDRLTRHVDLFPTLAELAGARIPDQLQLDGRSLLPLIHDPDCSWEDRYSFFHKGRWNKAGARGRWGKGNTDPDKAKFKDFAVRSEQWRLVEPNALYDIKEDPGETNNLIDAYPEVASDMLNAYEQWWHEVRELMINEDATLDTPKPFMVQFEQQKMEQGIPDWQPPEIGSLDSDVE
jgi:arylsulfatase